MTTHTTDKHNAIRNDDEMKDCFYNPPFNSQVRGNRWVSLAITITIAITIASIVGFLIWHFGYIDYLTGPHTTPSL